MGKDIWSKAGAYFIIIIMVFSSVGFALYFTKADNSQNPAVDVNQAVGDTLPMNFTSTVNGVVKDITKTYMLLGDTNISDIAQLDKAILRVKGISNVDSKYSLNNDATISTTYKYIATITGYDINSETIALDIQNSTTELFSAVGLYPYALVDFDANVKFNNKDLNITKDYLFGNPIASILIMPSTLKGDNIKLQLNATFIGNSPTSITGYELENISATPKQIQAIQNAVFTPKVFGLVLQGPDFNKLDINKLDDMFDGNIISDLNNSVVNFSSEDINQDKFISDLNSLIINEDLNADYISTLNGTIFVDKLLYLDTNYDYNNLVDLSIGYDSNYDFTKEMTFMLNAYLYRDKILGVDGQLLGNNFSINLNDQ